MTQKLQCDGSPQFCSDLVSSGLVPEKILKCIKYMPFQKARRRKLPIYEVLLTELCEEGCLVAAKYFSYLMEKESRLVKDNLINVTLKDHYPKLMIRLLQNVKLAETTYIEDPECGATNCLKILYDSLVLLDTYESILNWLLEDVYRIFVHLSATILRSRCNCACTPIIAKMFCKFGVFLAKKERNLPLAVIYFKKTLDMCRGELWPAEDLSEDNRTIHDLTAVHLAKVLIAFAKAAQTPVAGLKFTRNALAALTEINYMQHATLFGEVMLMKIQYFMDNQDLHNAMSCILFLQRHLQNIEGYDSVRLTCELFLIKGNCYKLMQQTCKALIKFKQCRVLSSKYNMKNLSGRASLCLGELYEKYPSKQDLARQCIEEAKQCFNDDTANTEMKKFSKYALTRLTAKAYFPKLIRTMKSSSSDRCALFRLYHWKSRLTPLQREKCSQAYFLPHDDLPECSFISYEEKDDLDESFVCQNIAVAAENVLEGRITSPDDSLIENSSHFRVRRKLPHMLGNML